MVRLSVLLAFLVLVAACDSGGNPPDPTLGGTYAFETPPDDSTTGLITIAESEGNLVGSGDLRIRDADGTVVAAFPISSIDGTHAHPNVSMQWEISGQGPYSDIGPWEVNGTASDDGDRITGTLTRDEGNTTQIVLTAQ